MSSGQSSIVPICSKACLHLVVHVAHLSRVGDNEVEDDHIGLLGLVSIGGGDWGIRCSLHAIRYGHISAYQSTKGLQRP